ncbi:DMT family transporter [Rubrobacter indicoceani]|uniref:DMT family transporter n=1 Tax=Rubrobacter indicoceani TaxID=2051957 RepID=UPI000E5BD19D|nr:EamA family transporter [Rubrobacter indicoceani]
MRKWDGRLLGAFLVALAAIIWGTLGLVAKFLYAEGVAFEAVVATRALGAFLVIFSVLAVRRRLGTLRVGARDLASLVPLGIVSIGCFYLLYFYTVQETEVGTAAVLLYSSPAFVVVLARVFLKEALSVVRLAALTMTAVGILLVVGVTSPSELSVSPFVVLTGLGAGLSYGLYSVVGKPLTARLPSSTITCYILGVGAAVLVVFALPKLGTLAGLTGWVYLLLAASAVVHTALTYALYTAGLKLLEAGQAAIIAMVEPVVAGAVGVFFLSEELTVTKVAGAVLVVGGAAVAQIRLSKPRRSRLSSDEGASLR